MTQGILIPFFAATMLTCVHTAGAQILPGPPITLVVPFPPGASADTLMRLVTKAVSDKTGQVFVVDNRSGAGGSVGATSVKQAAPNGHTLLQANAGSHAILTALQSDLGYDPVKDFTPITLLWNFPHMLVVPADSPAKSVKELVALAKSKTGWIELCVSGSRLRRPYSWRNAQEFRSPAGPRAIPRNGAGAA